MRRLIVFYLLMKSGTGRKMTFFDRDLAAAVMKTYPLRLTVKGEMHYLAPAYVEMIANMKEEAILPEAFGDWRLTVLGRLVEWLD